jgi:UDPglucose--hexose-1-phosphate uridylyltransferase
MLDFPHHRFNPLTRDWVLVSPQRTQRPWLGRVEKIPGEGLPAFDPSCYLCPGNPRASGARNPEYSGTFVFDNDFSAILPESGQTPAETHALFQARPETGICRVVCFSPRHDLTIPQLPLERVGQVVETWREQTAELYHNPNLVHVQVFENKGAIMGCSNPHPHSQIWSQGSIPNEPSKELSSQKDYLSAHGRPLLMDYVQEEHRRQERVVLSNDHFSAMVPFWAIWPFEILLVAHRPVPDLPSLTPDEILSLADIYRQLTIRYDNLFEVSFPYSMGFHQAPNDGQSHAEWVLHAHFYPPLLRSATIRKFMVGYEMLAMPQRDITPESSAERLRSLSNVHYLQHAD